VFQLLHHRLSRQDKLIRWGILGLSYAPILGAYLYNQNYRISFLQCPIRHLTGVPCPTCGMTRAFMAIARANFSEAVTYHLFSPLLFAGFAVVSVHVSCELGLGYKIIAFYNLWFQNHKLQLVLLFLFAIYYILRLYYWNTTGEFYPIFIKFSVIQSPWINQSLESAQIYYDL
jgi:Protein of unknown function (DUF2752)